MVGTSSPQFTRTSHPKWLRFLSLRNEDMPAAISGPMPAVGLRTAKSSANATPRRVCSKGALSRRSKKIPCLGGVSPRKIEYCIKCEANAPHPFQPFAGSCPACEGLLFECPQIQQPKTIQPPNSSSAGFSSRGWLTPHTVPPNILKIP